MYILNKLQAVIDYYDRTRGVGHTHAVLNGAREEGAFVLVHTQDFGKSLGKDVAPVTMGDFIKRTAGMRKPLVIDNYALTLLLMEAAEEIGRLFEHSRRVAKREIDSHLRANRLEDLNKEAQEEIAHLRDSRSGWIELAEALDDEAELIHREHIELLGKNTELKERVEQLEDAAEITAAFVEYQGGKVSELRELVEGLEADLEKSNTVKRDLATTLGKYILENMQVREVNGALLGGMASLIERAKGYEQTPGA
jgi:hypothetical protein